MDNLTINIAEVAKEVLEAFTYFSRLSSLGSSFLQYSAESLSLELHD